MPGWIGSNRAKRLPRDWGAIRTEVLRRDHRLCRLGYPGCTHTATEVDHVIANDDDSLSNLQSVCGACHKQKTARESAQARRVARARLLRMRTRPVSRHPGMRH